MPSREPNQDNAGAYGKLWSLWQWSNYTTVKSQRAINVKANYLKYKKYGLLKNPCYACSQIHKSIEWCFVPWCMSLGSSGLKQKVTAPFQLFVFTEHTFVVLMTSTKVDPSWDGGTPLQSQTARLLLPYYYHARITLTLDFGSLDTDKIINLDPTSPSTWWDVIPISNTSRIQNRCVPHYRSLRLAYATHWLYESM